MHKNTYLAQFLGMLTCARTSGQADFDHLWVGEGGNRWGIQGPWARAPCGILFLPKMVTPLRGSRPPLDNLPAPLILPPSKVQSACPCCYLSFSPGPLPTLTLCQTYLPWPTADNPLCARTKGTKATKGRLRIWGREKLWSYKDVLYSYSKSQSFFIPPSASSCVKVRGDNGKSVWVILYQLTPLNTYIVPLSLSVGILF